MYHPLNTICDICQCHFVQEFENSECFTNSLIELTAMQHMHCMTCIICSGCTHTHGHMRYICYEAALSLEFSLSARWKKCILGCPMFMKCFLRYQVRVGACPYLWAFVKETEKGKVWMCMCVYCCTKERKEWGCVHFVDCCRRKRRRVHVMVCCAKERRWVWMCIHMHGLM